MALCSHEFFFVQFTNSLRYSGQGFMIATLIPSRCCQAYLNSGNTPRIIVLLESLTFWLMSWDFALVFLKYSSWCYLYFLSPFSIFVSVPFSCKPSTTGCYQPNALQFTLFSFKLQPPSFSFMFHSHHYSQEFFLFHLTFGLLEQKVLSRKIGSWI